MSGLCTSRLCLRLPCPEDATELARLMAPGISARLASWPACMEGETALLRIEQARTAHAAGACLPMLLTRHSDGRVLGWISVSRSEADPLRGVLTYWIGEEFQGQGLMREAAPLVRDAAFRRLGITELRAAVQSDNAASRAVLRGLGMRLLGPGRIWCAARGREEPCEWWAVRRDALADHAMSTLAFVAAPPEMAAAMR
ncbi:GNAT family N-acetyltransferase [Falsiroseomonas sp. CW058]|uniref:GNAT family N-acetyltransferase n=1 Tax=Falsiroseomonas sp. CW058 TaxID=3388664 RepID=UPI003D314062